MDWIKLGIGEFLIDISLEISLSLLIANSGPSCIKLWSRFGGSISPDRLMRCWRDLYSFS
jgi:hypothetical protein